MTITYTEITKPSTPSYYSLLKPGIFDIFVFQSGEVYMFQDDNYKVFDDNTSSMYSEITRPS